MEEKKKRILRELTAEELILRSLKYKRKFRVIVRLVISNIFWLQEVSDIQEEGIGQNYRRNLVLIFKKGLGKTFLSLQQKSYLRKFPSQRTSEELAVLYRVIGGLKCFRKYSEEMKKKLCLVTRFHYFGPGRVIVRQGQKGYALYFIVTGRVKISQLEYDPALETNVSHDVAEMEAGDMFGEISLLHNSKRTATVTTMDDCELLKLTKDDFTVVLKSTVQSEWDYIVLSMKRFSYFEGWNTEAFTECCIYASVVTHEKGTIIVGNDEQSNYAFFLLKGICRLLAHLSITITKKRGITKYKLYSPPEIIAPRSSRAWSASEGQINAPSVAVLKVDSVAISQADLSDTEPRCAVPIFDSPSKQLRRRRSTKVKLKSEVNILPPNTKVYFMNICQFKELSCFSLGESYLDRQIVAETPVEILKIPRYFLYKRNIGNVWNKLKKFLETSIPSKDILFKEFVRERKWKEHCKEMKNNLLKDRSSCYSNKAENVPYYLRISS